MMKYWNTDITNLTNKTALNTKINEVKKNT